MKLVKWRPLNYLDSWRALEDIHDEISKIFDYPLAKTYGRGDSFSPAIDISEDKSNIFVEAEVPGFKQKDVKVSFKDNALRIIATRDEKKEEKKKNYHHLERFWGSFERVIPFTKKVEADKIKAQYKDGVLKVTLPKAAEEKVKEVEVKVE